MFCGGFEGEGIQREEARGEEVMYEGRVRGTDEEEQRWLRGETRWRDRKRKKTKMRVCKRGMNQKQEYDKRFEGRKERLKETDKSWRPTN